MKHRYTDLVGTHGRELTTSEVTAFIEQGFVRLEAAFSREAADEARAILWRDTGCDPDDPATWTKLVVRRGFYFNVKVISTLTATRSGLPSFIAGLNRHCFIASIAA